MVSAYNTHTHVHVQRSTTCILAGLELAHLAELVWRNNICLKHLCHLTSLNNKHISSSIYSTVGGGGGGGWRITQYMHTK